jgi:hypothetical protein
LFCKQNAYTTNATDRGFQIRLTDDEATPHSTALSVHEEDNYGLLSSPPQVSLPIIVHPLRLYTELYDFSPYELGSLRIRGNKIRAIVVDVAQDPPCRCEWVQEALAQIFKYAARVGCDALELPLLGHRYGGLQIDICLNLIIEALLRHKTGLPARLNLRMRRQYMAMAGRRLIAAGLMESRVSPLFRS